MVKIKDILENVKLAWISLISEIKSFLRYLFSSNKSNSGQDGNDHTRETSVEEAQDNEIDAEHNTSIEQELDEEEFFDAIEDLDEIEQDLDGEEFFDAVDEQETDERKEYEQDKCYNLQNGLQERTEFDRSTATFTLAFKIDDLVKRNFNAGLNKFRLCELKKNGDICTFTLKDDQNNCIELHSKCCNMYFPKYFEKHREKGTYTELFSPEENRIRNDIIILLQAPEEVSIFIKKFSKIDPRWILQSQIPDCPKKIRLEKYKDCFDLQSHNSSSLTLTHTYKMCGLSPIPMETNWPIKDILIRGSVANTFDQYINKQPKASCDEAVSSNFKQVQVTPGKQMFQSILR